MVNFVASGKKLIIFDAECNGSISGPPSYPWLPYPFSIGGPLASPTLAILQNNTLSSNVHSSPYYINASHLSQNTDAVTDANVVNTNSSYWCVDMAAANAGTAVAVHTYAMTGGDQGLYIYNGLDLDYLQSVSDAQLRKIWQLELQQPYNPSNLACNVTATGLTLAPASAIRLLNTQHTVTAKLTDLLGVPKPGVQVTFGVTAGPNASTFGTCNTASCLTSASGQVAWTYTGTGEQGTDQIQASFLNGATIPSQTATALWTPFRCPQPQGYWKNNPQLWPANFSLTWGANTYNAAQLMDILSSAVKGDASLILAPQVIAAELNIAASSSDAAPVASTLATARALLGLGVVPQEVKSSSTAGGQMTSNAGLLESYNKGQLTAVCAQ